MGSSAGASGGDHHRLRSSWAEFNARENDKCGGLQVMQVMLRRNPLSEPGPELRGRAKPDTN